MFVCPELDACVNSSVWCDGINHCPSGYDESFTHCSALLKLPAEALAGLSVSSILLFCVFSAYIYRYELLKLFSQILIQITLEHFFFFYVFIFLPTDE